MEERSSVEVRFPEGVQYGNALYRLRKSLKKLHSVEIHKRLEGALVISSKDALGAVLLTLQGLDGYALADVREVFSPPL